MKKSKLAAKFTFIRTRNKITSKMSTKPLFFYLWPEITQFFFIIFYDLGAEANIFDVYCSSSDLYFIVKSKMNAFLPIYY